MTLGHYQWMEPRSAEECSGRRFLLTGPYLSEECVAGIVP